jgi:hypothetical protein
MDFIKFTTWGGSIGALMPLFSLFTALTKFGNSSYWIFLTKQFFFPGFIGFAGAAGDPSSLGFWGVFLIALLSNILIYAFFSALIWVGLNQARFVLLIPIGCVVLYAILLFK